MLSHRRLRVESLESRRLLATTTIEAEPNDAPAQAQVFEFGDDGVAILQGTSAGKDDRDFFRFTAPADGLLEAKLPNRGTTLEIDNLLELEPHDGKTVSTAALLAGKTYLVRLRGVSSSSADYEATLTFTAGTVPPGTTPGESEEHGSEDHGSSDGGGSSLTVEDPTATVITDAEPNNTRGTSQVFELSASTRLEGSASKSDRDFFAFTVPADGTFLIGVRADGGGKVEVEVEDQFGNDVIELEPHDGSYSGLASLIAGRTYFLRVKVDAVAESLYAIDLQPIDPTNPPVTGPALLATSSTQATLNQLDTDGDDNVSPIDALNIINYLNSSGGSTEPHDLLRLAYDMDDDGYVGPVDALLVINYLNSGKSLASASTSATPVDPATVPPTELPPAVAPSDLTASVPVDSTPPSASVPPVDPTLVGGTSGDDSVTHDLNDDDHLDSFEKDESADDDSLDAPGAVSVASDSPFDDHGDDLADDYARSVDDIIAEYEREFEHAKV